MAEFKDARESTATCYKLECGHAFHTKCVIGVLQQTQIQCPTCNKHKTPEYKAKLERVALQLKAEIGRNPEVRALKQEEAAALAELKEARMQWKKEVREYGKARAAELKIREKRDYVNKSTGMVKQKKTEIARRKGGIYVEALRHQEGGRRRHWRDWKRWCMLHPSVHVRV